MARPSILGLAALTTTVAQVVTAATSSYTLEDTFDSSNFFDSFTWFTDADPTAGFVSYQDQSSATSAGLATIANNQVRLGVDSTSTVDSSTLSAYVGGDTSVGGRKSVRLQSKKTYTKMLMVADIEHMPVGCGTWPALWTWGTGSWPADGEIDIIEGANSQTTNAMTLHTSAGCTPSNSGQDPGTSWYDGSTGDCSADSGSTGCPQRGTSTSNFGAGFNSAQGGVYAMEWTDAAISIWFWPRSSIPSGISSSSTVDTGSLGTPLARFEGGSGCDIASHFQGHVITINTALCGQWAGKAWAADGTCASQADSCAAWVANNPGAFADAYWLFNSIKVYTAGASSTNSSSTAASTKRDPVMDFRIGTTVAGSGGAGGGGRGGEEAPWEAGRGGTQQTADSTLVADMGQKRGLSEVFDGVKDVWDDAKNDGKNAWDTAKNSIGGSSTDENEDRDQDEMASTTSDARPLRESVALDSRIKTVHV
ncbi:family 16 glycoside hydrolase [Cryphonectria parasitica EP155]|uniref:Family 16 glycoside hydrolase n=1 Tax=Cryphonectria parasitica (strain ATCC 38755 / EP155) TaxID=660469 RepID=A0A9P4XY81_CRYP1|nr:family 16 glycoside hydrolase [Cryphonectria parasitica EP155]KAF3762972.1 family 16 glycoside hydrolase [Cryphonectria parasitica EP155]